MEESEKTQAMLDYFSPLGFEAIPIEDGLTALCFEEDPDGEYALITNEDGVMPDSLDHPLLLSYYTGKGAFLWSTGFKDSSQFTECWANGTTFAEKMQAAERHRDLMIAASPLAKLLEGNNP